jgi:hypothetical protein
VRATARRRRPREQGERRSWHDRRSRARRCAVARPRRRARGETPASARDGAPPGRARPPVGLCPGVQGILCTWTTGPCRSTRRRCWTWSTPCRPAASPPTAGSPRCCPGRGSAGAPARSVPSWPRTARPWRGGGCARPAAPRPRTRPRRSGAGPTRDPAPPGGRGRPCRGAGGRGGRAGRAAAARLGGSR